MLSSLLEVDGIQDTAQNAIGMHSEFFSEHTDLSLLSQSHSQHVAEVAQGLYFTLLATSHESAF